MVENNEYGVATLLHELGHCVYNLNISPKLVRFDQGTYPAMTEAVAMLIEDFGRTEDIFKDLLSKKDLEIFKKSLKNGEESFFTRSLNIINFEKEMYKNPGTKKYLIDRLFKFGTSLDKDELIKLSTGKKLSVDTYINRLK